MLPDDHGWILTASAEAIHERLPRKVRWMGPERWTPDWKLWVARGRFLHLRAPWAWFATLTFAAPVVSTNKAIARTRAWLDALAKRVGDPVLGAYAIERHVSGALHVHVLVSFPSGATRVPTADGDVLWNDGFARVRVYDPRLGGAWYVAKHADAWDLTFGRPTKHMPRPSARAGLPVG